MSEREIKTSLLSRDLFKNQSSTEPALTLQFKIETHYSLKQPPQFFLWYLYWGTLQVWGAEFWIGGMPPGFLPSLTRGSRPVITPLKTMTGIHNNIYCCSLIFQSWLLCPRDFTISPRSPNPLIVTVKGIKRRFLLYLLTRQSCHSEPYYRCFTTVAGGVQVRSSLTLDLEVTSESGQQPRCQGLSLDLGVSADAQPTQDVVEDLPLERQGLVLFMD